MSVNGFNFSTKEKKKKLSKMQQCAGTNLVEIKIYHTQSPSDSFVQTVSQPLQITNQNTSYAGETERPKTHNNVLVLVHLNVQHDQNSKLNFSTKVWKPPGRQRQQ